MKIQIISDLHLEFGDSQPKFNNADLVILAGDIHIGTKGIEWILETIPNKPVIYVIGNHEYYKGTYPKTLRSIEDQAKSTNVHVLEKKSIKIDDIRFHGTTLWTDFSLYGSPSYYGSLCQTQMNDYKKIRTEPNYSKLRSKDVYDIHHSSITWLEKSLSESDSAINIVVTHHAPSPKSLPNTSLEDPISCAYASNLESTIESYKPNFWIHGHVHAPVRYQLHNTEIICNPHGYMDEEHNGYEKELILEIVTNHRNAS